VRDSCWAFSGEETQFPSVFTNEMSANNLANSDLGARAEDDAAGGMGDRINGQREDGEKSRTAGGGAGQHHGAAGLRQWCSRTHAILQSRITHTKHICPHPYTSSDGRWGRC